MVAVIAGGLLITAAWLATRADYSQPLAGDVASLAVAGATLLLADFTALLAWFTRGSIAAALREAVATEKALALTIEQAALAREALEETRNQAEMSRKQAAATDRQAEIAGQTLEGSWRPILASPPANPLAESRHDDERFTWLTEVGDVLRFSVTLRNIGRGPAFITEDAFMEVGESRCVSRELTSGIVSPGEPTRIRFQVDIGVAANGSVVAGLRDNQPFSVFVRYADLGGHRWRTTAHLRFRDTNFWSIAGIDLFDGEDLQPYAHSGKT